MSDNTFLDRANWDRDRGEIRDGDIRYLMIRSDALMGLFKQLPVAERGRALLALTASIFEHGGRSARAYQGMGATDRQALLDVIANTAPQLGWGIWQFGPGNEPADDMSFELTVRNSPFAAGFGPSDTPVCAAIVGMLQAVGSMVLGSSCTVREHQCVSVNQVSEHCHFVVTRR